VENWVLVPILSALGDCKKLSGTKKKVLYQKKAREKKVPKWSSAKWGEVCEKGKKKQRASKGRVEWQQERFQDAESAGWGTRRVPALVPVQGSEDSALQRNVGRRKLLNRSGRSAGGGEWGKAEGSAIAIRWHRRGRKQKNSKGRRIGKTLRVQRWGDVGEASWHVRVLPSRMGTGIAEQGQQGIWGNGVGGDPASKRRKSTSRSLFFVVFFGEGKGTEPPLRGPLFVHSP
jgi:hypothetical protein